MLNSEVCLTKNIKYACVSVGIFIRKCGHAVAQSMARSFMLHSDQLDSNGAGYFKKP